MNRLSITLLLVALWSSPLLAGEAERTLTADGVCERLVIAGEDLTAACGTPVIQIHHGDGRVSVSAGTGGQAWFGLADPERLLMFYGTGEGDDWTDHLVDQVVSHDSDDQSSFTVHSASGHCTYRDAGPGLLITCEAEDDAGAHHALTYRTDGRPGFSF